MAKRNSGSDQHTFNFSKTYVSSVKGGSAGSSPRSSSECKVVRLVDSRTQSGRDEAIMRVQASGIFKFR